MGKYSTMSLTAKGRALLAKVQTNECDLVLTRAATGAGICNGNPDTESYTALIDERQSFPISSFLRKGDGVLVRFVASNFDPSGQGGGLEEAYTITEIGIFAEDPDDGEVLYAISFAAIGDYVPEYDESSPMSITFNIYIYVGTDGDVKIQADSTAYALAEDVSVLSESVSKKPDYEEGTFTPKVYTDTSGTVEWTEFAGTCEAWYKKVGKMVYISMWLFSSGSYMPKKISGLPFAAGRKYGITHNITSVLTKTDSELLTCTFMDDTSIKPIGQTKDCGNYIIEGWYFM